MVGLLRKRVIAKKSLWKFPPLYFGIYGSGSIFVERSSLASRKEASEKAKRLVDSQYKGKDSADSGLHFFVEGGTSNASNLRRHLLNWAAGAFRLKRPLVQYYFEWASENGRINAISPKSLCDWIEALLVRKTLTVSMDYWVFPEDSSKEGVLNGTQETADRSNNSPGSKGKTDETCEEVRDTSVGPSLRTYSSEARLSEEFVEKWKERVRKRYAAEHGLSLISKDSFDSVIIGRMLVGGTSFFNRYLSYRNILSLLDWTVSEELSAEEKRSIASLKNPKVFIQVVDSLKSEYLREKSVHSCESKQENPQTNVSFYCLRGLDIKHGTMETIRRKKIPLAGILDNSEPSESIFRINISDEYGETKAVDMLSAYVLKLNSIGWGSMLI